jgi:hypothetical protein
MSSHYYHGYCRNKCDCSRGQICHRYRICPEACVQSTHRWTNTRRGSISKRAGGHKTGRGGCEAISLSMPCFPQNTPLQCAWIPASQTISLQVLAISTPNKSQHIKHMLTDIVQSATRSFSQTIQGTSLRRAINWALWWIIYVRNLRNGVSDWRWLISISRRSWHYISLTWELQSTRKQ